MDSERIEQAIAVISEMVEATGKLSDSKNEAVQMATTLSITQSYLTEYLVRSWPGRKIQLVNQNLTTLANRIHSYKKLQPRCKQYHAETIRLRKNIA